MKRPRSTMRCGCSRSRCESGRRSLLAGRHFVPDSEGSLIRVKRAGDYGLNYPMFHRQSSMFVGYIRDENGSAFDEFLNDIQQRSKFAQSFGSRFGTTVAGMWEKFVSHLRKKYRTDNL